MPRFTEMDATVTLMQQMDADVSPVVLINRFTVAPEEADLWLKAWAADAAFMKTNLMKYLLLMLLPASFLAGCRTPDYTRGEQSTCEVHHVAMFKRAVPFAHGMIPMSRVEGERGEWKRRKDHYPHPGDCQPATGIVLPGEEGRVVVYVCRQCEAARKQMEPQKP